MQLPARIGKYELQEFLGGGMSHVFRAVDTVLNRTVAVKILTEQGSADPDAKARFLQEAKVAAGLMHDNVIRIHDYGEEQGKPFIVMEFLVGSDLRHAIRENLTGDLASKLKIAIQGARALEYVHAQRIVHRDIKPENMHIDGSGRVRLMDFGIAKAHGLSLTKTGFQLGTPYYMSPEQVMGKPVTPLVDVYAYGILLYELLAGKRPVTGDTVERLFFAILNETLDMQPLVDNGTPRELIHLVQSMTAKDPLQRPGSFTEVIGVLESVLNSITGPLPLPAGAPPALQQPAFQGTPAQPARELSGKRLTMILGAIIVVFGVAAGVLLYLNRERAKESAARIKDLPAILANPNGEMRIVPSGVFLVGNNKEQIALPAFYIDKTEVTNEQYKKFADERSRPLPKDFPQDQPKNPVVNVSVLEAKDYCQWANKRLPLPIEWEKAARGTDGRTYPWGDSADASRANVTDSRNAAGLVAADSMPDGASPYGLLHMAGNVWEWVDEARVPSMEAVDRFASVLTPPPTAQEPWYSAKGGSFRRDLTHTVAYEFITLPARFTADDVGFRCAMSIK